MVSRIRPLVALLAAGSVLVAACGGSDEAEPAAESSSETTERVASSEETVEEPAPDPTDAPTDEPAPDPTDAPTDGPEELTASYRGVTPDSIKVGFLLLDLVKLKENAGIELLWGDNEGQYREAIDFVNANGGVNGRMIDPVFVYVDPLSETGYQEACVQLTGDEEVFAVLGFARPAESTLCYTETGDTPFMGYLSDITGDVFERSVLPLVTSNPLPDRIDLALVDVVASTGALDGKSIAVLGNNDGQNAGVAGALEDGGFDVVDVVVTNAPSDDAAADAAELDVIIERWRSLGVDYVVSTASVDRPLAAANRAGFEADWATNVGSILSLSRFESGATEAEVARTVVVQEPQVELIYESGHALTVDCVDRWDANHPDEPAVFFPGDGDVDNLQRIARSCNQVETFAMLASAAGVDLTPTSFAGAVANVGKYEVPMQPFASLSADKWDAGDSVSLYTWDADRGDFVAGDFIDIG